MALYEANVAFEHGGIRVDVGDIIDASNYLFILFPSRFTAVADFAIDGATTTVTGLGTVDPSSAGVLWNNGGTLMVSGGS
jgi:hypothetical protein